MVPRGHPEDGGGRAADAVRGLPGAGEPGQAGVRALGAVGRPAPALHHPVRGREWAWPPWPPAPGGRPREGSRDHLAPATKLAHTFRAASPLRRGAGVGVPSGCASAGPSPSCSAPLPPQGPGPRPPRPGWAVQAAHPSLPLPCRTCTAWKATAFPPFPCSSTTCCAPSSPSPRRAALC